MAAWYAIRGTLGEPPMRGWCGIAVLVGVLACGGFMEDRDYVGAEAVERIGLVAGTPLPSRASDARVVETTGIDWLLTAEVAVPREAGEAWFASLTLPCDQPTGQTPETEPPVFRILGDPEAWKAPTDARWETKYCESGSYSGPHYSVSITREGDPAWVWVHGMTL
jgi:hypothetical protein